MSNFFSCYLWWLVLGIFLGLLFCWLYDIFFRRDQGQTQTLSQPPSPTPPAARPVRPTEPKAQPAAQPKPAPKPEPRAESKPAPKPEADKSAAESGQNPKDFGFKLKKSDQGDDLTVIEGIGPKISQLLYAEGITTFQMLADTSYERLKEILDKAGPNYRLARPDAWPKEAALAARGDWKELKALQDRLVGGIEFDK